MADGSVISGEPCRNRGQSIDSLAGYLFNLNRGYAYRISGAIYTHGRREREWESTKSDPSLAAIRVWMMGPGNGG